MTSAFPLTHLFQFHQILPLIVGIVVLVIIVFGAFLYLRSDDADSEKWDKTVLLISFDGFRNQYLSEVFETFMQRHVIHHNVHNTLLPK